MCNPLINASSGWLYHFNELVHGERQVDVGRVKLADGRPCSDQCAAVRLEQMPVKSIFTLVPIGCTSHVAKEQQEGLAVASIARDDPSTLPGDDSFPRARMHRYRSAR